MSITAQFWIAVITVAFPVAGLLTFMVDRLRKNRSPAAPGSDGPLVWQELRTTVSSLVQSERGKLWRLFDDMATRLETDIAARKKAEADLVRAYEDLEQRVEERTALLRESETKYRIVANHTHAWEFWQSPEGEFIYLSPSCLAITGYSVSEFKKDPALFHRVIHPEDRHLLERCSLKFVDDEGCDFECRIVARDGTVRWIRHISHNLLDDDGNFLGTAGSNRDITAETLLKQQLLGSLDKLGSLTAELSLSEERERRRIALTLHDGVVQELAICKLKLDIALQKGQLPDHPVLHELKQMLDRSMLDLRDLSTDLSPPILYDLGLGPAFVSLGEKFARKFAFRFIFHPGYGKEDYCENLKISVFQFFRELMMNIVKHAEAATVTVLLRQEGDRLVLSIDDDGKGFDLQTCRDGFGLANIRQRIHYLRGELEIRSKPGIGTRVVIAINHRKGCCLHKDGEACRPCEHHANNLSQNQGNSTRITSDFSG